MSEFYIVGFIHILKNILRFHNIIGMALAPENTVVSKTKNLLSWSLQSVREDRQYVNMQVNDHFIVINVTENSLSGGRRAS